MNFNFIKTELIRSTLLITINRPEKLNALNIQTLNELNILLEDADKNAIIKALIITGEGEKAFVAGADISELKSMDKDKAFEFSQFGQSIFNKIENLSKPVIAAINGFALGGGFELALACHIRFASENAKFGLPEINLGVIPGYGGTVRLTALTNKNIAAELILSGNFINSEEAYRLGIINKIYPQNDLLAKTLEFSDIITQKSSIALNSALKSVFTFNKKEINDSMQTEATQFFKAVNSHDFDEGTLAFLEKRKPKFKDY
ncbi:MAG TPA: enoyl-CoA hydratase-related protein [Melioribacteraceae bacterium]|nr:enoyl-CoA hydratase-related protein [Melioribacteraceae bacterium]